jgi:hypothetical protein
MQKITIKFKVVIYVHVKKLGNDRVGKKMFLYTIPQNNNLFE